MLSHFPSRWHTTGVDLQTNVLVAWLVNLVYSTALVAASSCSVVFGAPAAAGAGVAEVMAFLNGVRIPKARTTCARSSRVHAPSLKRHTGL